MSKIFFNDNFKVEKGTTVGRVDNWRLPYDDDMQADVDEEGTHIFWNQQRTIRVSNFVLGPNLENPDACPLEEITKDYENFEVHNKNIKAKIKHWQDEEDGKPYWATMMACSFGFELVQISLFYGSPEEKEWAVNLCSALTRTSEIQVLAATEFKSDSIIDEIIKQVFAMNQHAKSKNKELFQTLYIKGDDGKWNILAPQTSDDRLKIMFWNHINYVIQKQGIREIMVFSDMTITQMDTGKKTHALVLHYLNKDGVVIVKNSEYIKKMFKGIIFDEIKEDKDKILPYWLEPIAKQYLVKK